MDVIRVSSTQLKSKMGSYMMALRAGREFLVTDRDRPIACLIPYQRDQSKAVGGGGVEAFQPRDPAAEPLGRVTLRAIRPRTIDTTAMLLEDRTRR